MTDQYPGSPSQPDDEQTTSVPPPPPPPPPMPYAPPSMPYAPPAPLTPQQASGPIGQIRGTGFAILLAIVTFGIYEIYWFYKVHKEMKDHSGQGIGGGIALLLTILVGVVMPYITSNEVGGLYSRRGQQPPVSAATGLWYFPGIFIIVGPIIWFVKTNRALNDYWASLGATP